jgi:hypothetical protein
MSKGDNTMVNENLENVGIENLSEVTPKTGRFPWNNGETGVTSIRSQVLWGVGGSIVGIAAGYVLCKFVLDPILNKKAAKKETPKIEVEPAKTEEKD